MLPYLGRDLPNFAFLVHFRSVEDVYRISATAFLRRYSKNECEFLDKASTMVPLTIGAVKFGSSPIWGDITCIMRFPEQIEAANGREYVWEGAQTAIARGVKIIGLGALTAPVTGAGATIVERVPRGITITTGNAYTAAVVRANVRDAASHFEYLPTVAIVGCTGSVGVAASQLIGMDGFHLILIGRNLGRTRRLLDSLKYHAIFSDDVSSAIKADIVVALTHSSLARLNVTNVKPGATIIDVAQPANIESKTRAELEAAGIKVLAGGLVAIPNYSCSCDMGIPKTITYACLAETYIFARASIREHSVGRASVADALRLEQLASQYGIEPIRSKFQTAALSPAISV